ncbi:MAG TPA: M10 family metallopeptidase C-terminal domain-containing protein [Allosphingosinicella sp.]|nr:M10 family metallopeptidase C-terminal domain-containing protein [Allosphingosinicella sp.]
MCWICDKDAKAEFVTNFWAQKSGMSALHFAAASAGGGKYYDAVGPDGVGGELRILNQPVGLVVTADEAGDGIGVAPGNPVITVGAPAGVASINIIGDRDFFQVTLEAGKTYEIGQYAKTNGPNGVPLSDAYLELYDAAGNLIVSADGGGPNTPSGLDALLTYTALTSGTYYINFRAYDNVAEDGPNGDLVGDYEYFVREADSSAYKPYYGTDNPLYALDWGSQVDGTVRNPDGNEGTRSTGNAQGTPDNKGETVGYFGQSTEGKNVIKIYFAKAGDVYTPEDPTSPGIPPAIVAVGAKDFEITAVMISLREFEKVADLVYVVTENRAEADFHYVTYSGTPGPGVSLLGSMSPPNESDEGLAQFNSGDARWNATNLQQGGFSFVTLIHEFGHGHGMSHPHDNGGRSGVMRGVVADGPAFDYTTGDFDLNQGVFTMMSYEDGWQASPYGNAPTNVGYGYLGGLMAFDIAVIQDKYGVNEDYNTGDDTYILKDENAAGTFYYSIWDAGGNDTIEYQGTRNTTIDLREATLKYEVGGGGFMSYAFGIFGGFTIANGVTIENATTGDGDDTLTGNAANNVMRSGGGKDLIVLDAGGDDTVFAGAGNDFIYFGAAMTSADKVDGGEGTDTVGLIGTYDGLVFSATSLVGVERLALYSTSRIGGSDPASYNITMNNANVLQGQEFFVGAASLQANEKLTFNGTAETDGRFTVLGGAGGDIIAGGATGDYLAGNAGDDQLFGMGGNDTLVGGAGADQLRGGFGNDTFRFLSASDSAVGAPDRIVDFNAGGGSDKIDLAGIDANSGVDGDQAFTFIGSAAFTGAGQLRAAYDASTKLWSVEGDIDGDGNADFAILVTNMGTQPLVMTDFIL